MCNKLFIPIKAVASAGSRFLFVPCGKCEDCRQAMKNSWVFRLRVELDKLCAKGWQIGFFTLTYSDEFLPLIPECLFKTDYRPVPCFSKDDISDFFTKLKKWLLRSFDCRKIVDKETKKVIQDTRCRYMLCSEYGEHTQRPHYHGIICVPPNVDMRSLHRKIKSLWYHDTLFDVMKNKDGSPVVPNQKGYVYPFNFEGGYDSHGYRHKEFVCSSVKAAALYAAKYCCKDLAWYESLLDSEFHKSTIQYLNECGESEFCYVNDNELDYSNPLIYRPVYPHEAYFVREYKMSRYRPFHYQSKGLGSSWLDGKSDAQLLKALKKGVQFVGDDRLQGLPVYLKNKILFTPDYSYEINPDTGELKRLVRRKSRKFFKDNLSEVFTIKCNALVEKLSVMLSEDYYIRHGISKKELEEFRALSLRSQSLSDVAAQYLAYYGVPYHECLYISPAIQWYRRYDDGLFNVTGCPLVDESYWSVLQYEITFLFNLYAKFDKVDCDVKKRNNREIARIHDLWLSQE